MTIDTNEIRARRKRKRGRIWREEEKDEVGGEL